MEHAVLVRRKLRPAGQGAVQGSVGGDDGVAGRRALGGSKVQRGGFVGVKVVPRVVVVVPLRTAGAGRAAVKADDGVSLAGCLVRDNEHTGALGGGCREETAVGSGNVLVVVQVDGVVGDGHDVRAGWRHVEPVAYGVAAADLRNVRRIALQHLNVEARLDHDVACIVID